MSVDALKILLENEHSKKNTEFIAGKILNKEITFSSLSKLILSNEGTFSQRAAWVVSALAEKKFDFQPSNYDDLILMVNPKYHDAVLRNSIRTLAKMKIKEKDQGILFDRGIALLKSKTTATAIQTWIVDLLMNIADSSKELQHKIKLILEDKIPLASIGIKGKMLKTIQKINNNFNS